MDRQPDRQQLRRRRELNRSRHVDLLRGQAKRPPPAFFLTNTTSITITWKDWIADRTIPSRNAAWTFKKKTGEDGKHDSGKVVSVCVGLPQTPWAEPGVVTSMSWSPTDRSRTFYLPRKLSVLIITAPSCQVFNLLDLFYVFTLTV